MEGSVKERPLRVFFFPLVSPGHMIPIIDIAKLFAGRQVAATVITTPGNEPLARPALDRANAASPQPRHPLQLAILRFPSSVAGLVPPGGENLAAIPSSDFSDLITAVFALRDPLHRLLHDARPDCLVSDAMFAWAADTAAELGIANLVFYGHGLFPQCVHRSIELHAPHADEKDDSEAFFVGGLPHRVEMTRSELSNIFVVPELLAAMRAAEEKSFGIVMNTFHELEPDYAELYRSWTGRRLWCVGPVSLCNRASLEKADRGSHGAHDDLGRWLRWLDSKPARSVVYVCFGSLCELSSDQLREIAAAIEASGRPFFWVVRGAGGTPADWLEERVEERSVVVRGWAPQALVLSHAAVGCFVTHCGWNSTLEAVSAGVPMAAWPLMYEQFLNAKFVTRVLRVGVMVERAGEGVVTAERIGEAVERIMGGGEAAEEMRRRAKEYAAQAKAAMEAGGSSYEDLTGLIDELRTCRAASVPVPTIVLEG